MEAEKIKRSKGITIFAWVMLVVGAMVALALIDVKSFFDSYKHLPHTVVVGLYWGSAISLIIGFVGMIGILQLKESMRKVAVAISVFDTLFGIPFFFQLKGLRQSLYEMVVASISKGDLPSSLNANDMTTGLFVTTVFVTSGVLILNLLFVWYFTRPNIKEQFK